MMRFLRRFRRLNIWAFALLRRRLAALVRTKTTYLALLAIVAVPVSWTWFAPGDTDYLGPWLILSISLALLGLNGKVPRRKNVRRPLPPKIFWTGVGISVLGLVYLAVGPLIGTSTASFEPIPHTVLLVVSVYIVLITLSFVINYTSHLLTLVWLWRWHVGFYASPSNIYGFLAIISGIFTLGILILIFIYEKPRIEASFIAASLTPFVCAIAFWLRHEPWRRATPLAAAILPHVASIFYLSFFVMIMFDALVIRFQFRPWDIYYAVILISVGLFFPLASLLYWTSARLRVPLVTPSATAARGSALSIYPDAATYVDIGGYAGYLENLIRSSDGGVIGVTGVRGAGKSALLGYVLSQFERRHGVLWMTAPVSHERGMAFLMSVCRAVCTKVLRDAEPILYGKTTDRGRAFAEFLRRGSAVVVVLLLLGVFAAFTWLDFLKDLGVDPASEGAPASRLWSAAPPLPYPERVRLHGVSHPVRTGTALKGDVAYAAVINAEREAIRDLLVEAVPILGALEAATKEVDSAQTPQYLLLPVPGGIGFNFVFFNSTNGASIFVNPTPWSVNQDSEKANAQLLSAPNYFVSPLNENYPHRNYYIHFNYESENINKDDLANSLIFMHYIAGISHDSKRLDAVEAGALIDYFNGLEVVRGYTTIQPQLRAQTALLRDALKLPEATAATDDRRPVELASILLLRAFFQKPEGMVFDTDRLRQLVNILTPYLAALDGETATPAVVAPNLIEPGAGPASSSQFQWLSDINLNTVLPYIGILFIFVLLFFGERIWRLLNFMLRGILNFKLLTVVRDSEDFLQYLYYSEGREASAGFSFRGLSLGGKKVLTARALTLQGLTDRYLEYVRDVQKHYNSKLIIAIDELDKITDPAEVRDILLEIKGALFEKGCFYLLSISEDAARAFRGRLSEGRDIFESSFDDVMSISQMDTSDNPFSKGVVLCVSRPCRFLV